MARWDEQIRDEHQALRAQAEDLGVALAIQEADPWARQAAVVWIVRTLRVGVEAHLRREEAVFFPALEQLLGPSASPLRLLREQHRELRGTIEQLIECLHDPALAGWEAIESAGRLLMALVEDHEKKSDRLLIDVLEYSLPKPELNALAQALGTPSLLAGVA